MGTHEQHCEFRDVMIVPHCIAHVCGNVEKTGRWHSRSKGHRSLSAQTFAIIFFGVIAALVAYGHCTHSFIAGVSSQSGSFPRLGMHKNYRSNSALARNSQSQPLVARSLEAEQKQQSWRQSAIQKSVEPASWAEKPRPPTLPAELFKPKQSLSQNFLCDPNYVFKMTSVIKDDSPGGRRVLELGPGTGALTAKLHRRYPDMVGVELDQRAMHQLSINVPGVTVLRSDVLLVNYSKLAEVRGGPLTVVGNLPYHVSCPILFCLADHANSLRNAHVTMQKEVADRILARPNSRKYGIPSVAFQIYSNPKRLFDLPPTAFFPRPNVMSSYVRFDFEAAKERRAELNVDPRDLKNFTQKVFNQRRKKMSNSLKQYLECHTTLIDELPPEYRSTRPEQMEPWEFVHLTQLMYGKKPFPQHFRRAWRGEFGRKVRD